MTTHTPGPWKAEPCTNGFRAPDEKDFQIVAANLICPGTVWGGICFEEGAANAHLIAEAPTMLESLREMLVLYEVFAGEDECDIEEGVCAAPICKAVGCAVAKAQRARAVIARAEGPRHSG